MKIEIDPIKWLLIDDEFFSCQIYLEKRKQYDRSFKYSISSGTSFLCSEVLEFIITSRDDDDDMSRTRFDSMEIALDHYKKFIEKALRSKVSDYYSLAVQNKYNDGKLIDQPLISKSLDKFNISVKKEMDDIKSKKIKH